MHAQLVSGLIPVLVALAAGEKNRSSGIPREVMLSHQDECPLGARPGNPRSPAALYRGTRVSLGASPEGEVEIRKGVAAQLEKMDLVPAGRRAFFAIYEDSGLICTNWLGTIAEVARDGPDLSLTVRFEPQYTYAMSGGLVMVHEQFEETYRMANGRLSYVRGVGRSLRLRGAISSY